MIILFWCGKRNQTIGSSGNKLKNHSNIQTYALVGDYVSLGSRALFLHKGIIIFGVDAKTTFELGLKEWISICKENIWVESLSYIICPRKGEKASDLDFTQ